MQAHIDNTRKQLGELGVMAHQTEAAERRILERSLTRLAEVQQDLSDAAPEAMTGGDQRYMDLVHERGQLQQVIAQARAHLAR